VQIVQLNQIYTGFMVANGLGASAPTAVVVGPLEVGAATQDGLNSLSWIWQAGSAAPQTQTIGITLPGTQPATDFAVSAMTSAGGQWLSVTPPGTIHCAVGVTPNPCANLQVSVNPSSLALGIYQGTITITPIATFSRPLVEPAVIPVALVIAAAPLPQTLINPRYPPNDNFLSLPPGFFTGPVSTTIVTDSGGNWLSASLGGLSALGAPTSVTVTANTAGLGAGSYSGDVVVAGSGNTLVMPVLVSVPGTALVLSASAGTGALAGDVSMAAQAGGSPPPAQIVPVSLLNCAIPGQCVNVIPNDLSSVTASVQTHSGGNWLSAAISQAQGAVIVSANQAGLSAGIYLGAVTLTASGIAPTQFPVVLQVEGGSPPALVVGPGFISAFEPLAGGGVQPFGPNMICVTSLSVPQNFTVQVSTSDGGAWLTTGYSSGTTPECVSVSINAVPLAPGNYSGNISFTSWVQSANVQVALVVAEPPGVPLLGAVVSADSTIPGALYPGEILAIHGLNLALSTAASGVNVLVGGIPASILSATPTLISAVVPYAVAGPSSVTVQVENSSGSTAVWTVPLAPQPAARPYHRLH
jgi:hypothetical protein